MTDKGEKPGVPVRLRVLWMLDYPSSQPEWLRAVEIQSSTGEEFVSERWDRQKRCWVPAPGRLGAPASLGASFIKKGDPEEEETQGHSISAPAEDWAPDWRVEWAARCRLLETLVKSMKEPEEKKRTWHTTIYESEAKGAKTKAILTLRSQGDLTLFGGDDCEYWLNFAPPTALLVLRVLAVGYFDQLTDWWQDEWEFCPDHGVKMPKEGWETARPPFLPEFMDFLWAAVVEFIKSFKGDFMLEAQRLCGAQGIPFEHLRWDNPLDS